MRVKIISTGEPFDTQVVDAETGEVIENITAIVWGVDLEHGCWANIKIRGVPVEIAAEATLLTEGEDHAGS